MSERPSPTGVNQGPGKAKRPQSQAATACPSS